MSDKKSKAELHEMLAEAVRNVNKRPCAWITEDTINQARGTRPLDVSHVDPADDPRKNDTRAFIK